MLASAIAQLNGALADIAYLRADQMPKPVRDTPKKRSDIAAVPHHRGVITTKLSYWMDNLLFRL
jgi:hypothetical protein